MLFRWSPYASLLLVSKAAPCGLSMTLCPQAVSEWVIEFGRVRNARPCISMGGQGKFVMTLANAACKVSQERERNGKSHKRAMNGHSRIIR